MASDKVVFENDYFQVLEESLTYDGNMGTTMTEMIIQMKENPDISPFQLVPDAFDSFAEYIKQGVHGRTYIAMHFISLEGEQLSFTVPYTLVSELCGISILEVSEKAIPHDKTFAFEAPMKVRVAKVHMKPLRSL